MQREHQSIGLASSGHSLNRMANRFSETLERHKSLLLAAFSIAYFGLTFYRASRKLFWFDELFTVYVSRLPDFKSVWHALVNSADFQLLLFILTRFSQHILGQGQISTRLPEMLGFWVFCLCLFRFVSLRLSALSAFVSLLFPLATGAYWYAYEARSYGLVLGFCGVALVSWQAVAERTGQRRMWLFALGASLGCALLTNGYAFLIFAPIVLGELWRTASRKRLDWPVWATIAAASLASLTAIPFMHTAVHVGSQPFFSASVGKLHLSYRQIFIPGGATMLAGWLLLTCLFHEESEALKDEPGLQTYELLALWSFVALPVFEFAAAKLTGAPFLSRYAISAVAGFAGLLGVAVAKRPALATAAILLIVSQIGLDFRKFASGSVLIEPSSNYEISTRAPEFSERYEWMAEDKTLPIVLIDDLDFMTTEFYAPGNVAPKLTYILWPREGVIGELTQRLNVCCNSAPPVVGLADFLASHDTFLVYGGPRFAFRLDYFVKAGATVTTKKETADHFLVLITYPKHPSN
jgi:hypothetical protein